MDCKQKEYFANNSNLKHEKPLDYFTRTRSNETPPDWIKDIFEFADFLDFLIHLTPLSDQLSTPEFEPDGCILWE